MNYSDPGCAYCPSSVRACRQGETEARGPGFCPTRVDNEGIACALPEYDDPETRRFAKASAEVESEGYCQ